MALTINTNIVNDADGYLLDTSNVKVGEQSGQRVMLDAYLAAEAETITGKEEKMVVFTSPPSGSYSANGFYSFGTMADQTLEITLADGSSADDMIYIAFSAGDNLVVTLTGNYVGAIPSFDPSYFYEIVGVWNVSLGAWTLSTRRILLE